MSHQGCNWLHLTANAHVTGRLKMMVPPIIDTNILCWQIFSVYLDVWTCIKVSIWIGLESMKHGCKYPRLDTWVCVPTSFSLFSESKKKIFIFTIKWAECICLTIVCSTLHLTTQHGTDGQLWLARLDSHLKPQTKNPRHLRILIGQFFVFSSCHNVRRGFKLAWTRHDEPWL